MSELAMSISFLSWPAFAVLFARDRLPHFVSEVALSAIPFIILIVAIIVALRLFKYRRERRRTAAIRAIAQTGGGKFFDRADEATIASLAGFGLFSPRPSQRIFNMIARKSAGVFVAVFDYYWYIPSQGGDGGGGTEMWCTVVHVESNSLQLPQFYVCPNGLFQKMTSMFRSKITFDAHPEFMRRYDLRFKDQRAAREAFHSGVVQLIETEPRTFYIEGAGKDLIVYPADGGYPDGRARPEEFPELLEFGKALGWQFLAGGNAEVVWV
jgi:hypothetical protein